MKDANEVVRRFMSACRQEIPDRPQPYSPVAQLYWTLIQEEFGELAAAWASGDKQEILDGGLDAIWVLLAFLNALGMPVEDGWSEVARSNLDKIDPATGAVIKRADGKVLKPAGWRGPDLGAVIAAAGSGHE